MGWQFSRDLKLNEAAIGVQQWVDYPDGANGSIRMAMLAKPSGHHRGQFDESLFFLLLYFP
jgi:hypothetical protein